jgi:hypothetical protein
MCLVRNSIGANFINALILPVELLSGDEFFVGEVGL